MSMFSVIQVNRIYLIFNPVHFLVDSSDIVNIVAVEVGTSDKAFKMKCVLSLWHVIVDLSATKLPLLYKGVKDAV